MQVHDISKMNEEELVTALLAAKELVQIQDGSPDLIYMSIKNLISIGIDMGYTKKHMEELVANLPEEK